MARPARREQILAAAEQIVRRDGVARLTLDAVAAEAGTSKGGLLYHFGSRDALVSGMLERHLASFTAALEGAMAADPRTPGRWTRGYLQAAAPLEGPADDVVTAGLLAAMASSPALADPLRARYAGWRERMADDGLDEADALVVALAADGLWMADLLGFAAPTGEQRRRVLARLRELAGAAAGPEGTPTTPRPSPSQHSGRARPRVPAAR